MRFTAQGPDIPPELLEARDRGEVVFFCGAGVSMPAGLPSFLALARNVVADLGVPAGDAAEAMLARALAETNPVFAPPMDQVFRVLQDDYGVGTVEAAVARRLRTPRNVEVRHHLTVLRLSADPAGRRRVVTTNFDPLFERADRRLRRFTPPHLPDLGVSSALEGIVYLHGRAETAAQNRTVGGLVLGSGDFGRAYLSEGWATRFIRQLLGRYTLVLLGYSADDPPVRYLLEGLRTSSGATPASIYAFGEGTEAEVQARWRPRGVRAIAYPRLDARHSALWDTLNAWAERADDPSAWRASVAEMARAGPHALSPHERGQVAALVETAVGARAFAEATPPLPAEWLCVFDPKIRYGRPRGSLFGDDQDHFDPLASYGLDSDPPWPEGQRREDPPPGVDYLSPTPDERQGASFASLGFAPPAQLSPRLVQLAWWCGRVLFEPATLWWAARQGRLHPMLRDVADRELSRNIDPALRPLAHRWRLFLETVGQTPDPHGLRWYTLNERVQRDGWTPSNLRDLARAIRPRLSIGQVQMGPPRPPETAERLNALVDLDVAFLEPSGQDTPLDRWATPDVVAAWREALHIGVSLLSDVHPIIWRTPALDADIATGHRMLDDGGAFFLRFAALFEALANANPAHGRAEALRWPVGEPFFFDKLRVWAWRRAELFDGNEVASYLLDLDEEAFWQRGHERELLWTLRGRWTDLGDESRQLLEARLVAGPPAWDDEDERDYPMRRGSESATRLGWLQQQGCELHPDTQALLPALQAADPRWTPAWIQNADNSREGRSGWVRREPDPTALLSVPLGDVLTAADSVSGRPHGEFVEAVPFVGLVRQTPARALAVLAYQARHGRYPVRYWQVLLGERDVELPSRVRRLIAARLAQLPGDVLVELRFYAPNWIQQFLPAIAADDLALAWRAWDAMFVALVAGGEAATQSGMGDSSVGGVPQRLSRRTYDHALNAPVGMLVMALIGVLDARQPAPRSGIPADVAERFAAAVRAPGEGGDHAVNMILRDLPWLDQTDPRYAVTVLAPLFAPEAPTAEPAWNGYVFSRQLVRPTLFAAMKRSFLEAFRLARDWRWSGGSHAALAEFLIAILTVDTQRPITWTEARRALQVGGEAACTAALDALGRRVDDGGWPDVRRVIVSAWPRELRLQTAETSRRFARIAMDAGDDFPDAVAVVLPFLQPVDNLDLYLFHLRRGENDAPPLATRFPGASLQLLDAVIGDQPPRLPYDLGQVLQAIATADPSLRQDLRWRRLWELTVR